MLFKQSLHFAGLMRALVPLSNFRCVSFSYNSSYSTCYLDFKWLRLSRLNQGGNTFSTKAIDEFFYKNLFYKFPSTVNPSGMTLGTLRGPIPQGFPGLRFGARVLSRGPQMD